VTVAVIGADAARFASDLGAEGVDVDPGRRGSKHHLITCGHGNPLAIALTADNVNDVTQTLPLVDAIPPLPGKRGRPRQRPKRLLGDRAYHSKKHAGSCAPAASRCRSPSPTVRTARGSAASAALGRRAHALLAAPVPPAARPLRTPRRHPLSIPPDRLQAHLLQSPHPSKHIVLGARRVSCRIAKFVLCWRAVAQG
jgi:hypothetical protein